MASTGFSFSGTSSSSSSPFSFNPSSASSAPSFGFGSGTTSSASASQFGASTLFGSSSSGAAPKPGLFGSSSGTTPTSNLFGSSSGATPASNIFGSGSSPASNIFRSSSSGGALFSNFFGSSSSRAAQTACPFGSTATRSSPSPSPSPVGTSTLFGTPAPASSNLFGSGAPTPGLFGASSAASANNSSSPLFGSGSAAAFNLFGSSTPATSASTFGSGIDLNKSQFGSSTSARTAPASAPLFELVIPFLNSVSSTSAARSSTSSTQTSPALVVAASSSGTTSTTTAALSSAPKLPSEITGKTVEESEVAKVVETQGTLERQLELIETHQDEEPKSGKCSQENGGYVVEESGSSRQSLDELDMAESDKKAPALEESKHFADGEPEIVSISLPVDVREEVNAVGAPVIQSSSSAKCSAWEPECVDAPGVPEGYTKIAESKFPITVEEFFNMFFSDGSVSFHESFHKKCGDKDFKCTKWHPHEKFGHAREVSFQHPIKIYFGARFDNCQEVQKYRVYRNCYLIVDTSQDISDVPYSDYFNVEGRWDVKPEGNDDSKPGCTLTVYTNVAFSKKTMWKGKIVQSTIEECREAYAIWIDLAHALLKQKNLEKEEGGGDASNLISNKQVQPERLANAQQYVEPNTSDGRITQIVADAKNLNRLVNDSPRGIVGEASVGSLVRDAFCKFFTSLRHLSTPSLLLVVMLAVIHVLMQSSIIVLLSRPQRIHVITQAGCTQGMSENRGDVLDSVNRQMKYLKEEMHFVQTLLEKVQNEHALLKGKL